MKLQNVFLYSLCGIETWQSILLLFRKHADLSVYSIHSQIHWKHTSFSLSLSLSVSLSVSNSLSHTHRDPHRDTNTNRNTIYYISYYFWFTYSFRIFNLFGSKVKLVTIVEGDLKAPFSIATTPRYRGGRNSFLWIAPLTLDVYLILLSVKQWGIKYNFWYDVTWDIFKFWN